MPLQKGVFYSVLAGFLKHVLKAKIAILLTYVYVVCRINAKLKKTVASVG